MSATRSTVIIATRIISMNVRLIQRRHRIVANTSMSMRTKCKSKSANVLVLDILSET
jgi:hypothetical protein